MNSVKLKGQWKQLTGRVKAGWGQLTHDQTTYAAGEREYREGTAEVSYGRAIEEAARQIREFDRNGTNSRP